MNQTQMDRKSFLKTCAVFVAGLFLPKFTWSEKKPAQSNRPLKEAQFYSRTNTLAG